MSLGSSGLTLGDLSLGGGADVSDVSLGGGKGLTGGGVSIGGLSGESFVDEMPSLNHHPQRAYSLDSFHYHNPSPPWGFGRLGYGPMAEYANRRGPTPSSISVCSSEVSTRC